MSRRHAPFRFQPSHLILALLAWTASPAINPKPAEAQAGSVVAAQIEMSTLRDGLVASASQTGFYVAIENLDDLVFSTNLPFNNINDGGGARVIPPRAGRFQNERIIFREGFFGDFGVWPAGGFLIFPIGRTQVGTEPYDEGTLLDPWFSPYYFFSPLGLIRGDAGAITQELYSDAFDRYAIVSLGPDGVLSGDDLILEFDGGVTRTSLSSLRGAGVTALNSKEGTTYRVTHGGRITLRGYALGEAARGIERKVFFDTIELTRIVEWTPTSITLDLPEDLFGSGEIHVRAHGLESNRLALTIPANGVSGWALYD